MRPTSSIVPTLALWSLALLVGPACSPPAGGGDTPDGGAAQDAPDADPGGGGSPDAGPASSPDAMEPVACDASFRLEGYADATEVVLTGDFTSWAGTQGDGAIALRKNGGGWTVEHTLQPGSHQYKFVIDGGTWLADPNNPDTVDDGFGGVNSVYVCGGGGSLGSCGDPQGFDWRDTVMYFAMIDRFYDSDQSSSPVPGASGRDNAGNSGQYEGGDLAGVRAKMDYLAELGVTSLWLSAPYDNRDSTGAAIDSGADSHQYSGYHGYWPKPANIDYSDPSSPDPIPAVESRIGDSATLKGLIDDAHNATSANGDGIKVLFDYVMNHVDLDSGLYAAHNDWFARDAGGQFALCGPGNLWNDPYWGTRCAFTGYLPPFDFDNADARAWSINDAVWWAKEYGIDGYRLDAIKHVPLSWLTDLRSRLNAELAAPGGRFYLVGETFDYFDRDLLKSFVDPETMLDGQFDFPFKRELCEAVFNPDGRIDSFSNFMTGNDHFYDRGPSKTAIMTTWIGNHDIPRAIHFADWKFGNCTEGSHLGNAWSGDFSQPAAQTPYQKLAVAYAIMMTSPGIPLLYYGDEIGLAGGGDPGNRRMMIFEDDQLNQHQIALRSKVQKLAGLRGRLKSLGRGSRTTLSTGADTWVYEMSGCGEGFAPVVVAINRTGGSRSVAVPAGSWYDEISEATIAGGAEYTLPAYGYLVLTSR